MPKTLLKSAAVLDRYPLSRSTLYRLRVSGKIAARKVAGRSGHEWLFERKSLDEYFGLGSASATAGKSVREMVREINARLLGRGETTAR